MEKCEYLRTQFDGMYIIESEKCSLFEVYIEELLHWNKKVNLTAIVDRDDCWEKHIADSLLLAHMLKGNEFLLDIGSGAGLPSIPLKIMLPELNVISVDSVDKKIRFQRHVARKLKIGRFSAQSSRIELLQDQYSHQFDVITSRAFASLELFLEYALPFLNKSGRIIAMKSTSVTDEIEDAEPFLEQNNLYISQYKQFILQPSGSVRVLLEIRYKH